MSSLWIPAPASASQTPKASVNPISSTEQRSDTGFRCRPVICPHCFPSFVASEINVASSGKSQPARPAQETGLRHTTRVPTRTRVPGAAFHPQPPQCPLRGLGHVPSQGHKPGVHQLPERRFLGPDDLRGSEQCIWEKRLELRPPGGKAQVPGSPPGSISAQLAWHLMQPRVRVLASGAPGAPGAFWENDRKRTFAKQLSHTRAQQGHSSRALHSLS